MKRILLALAIICLLVPTARHAEARVDVSIDFFYTNLSGGSWIEVGDYGYCWQPTVAVRDRGWRPYADGYWAYTDYGWTWVSYEDFGWATYHYGRWVRLRSRGWVWVPGYEWAPAWVSWRTGGNYVGWAPLPPRRYGYGGREPIYEGRPISGYVDIEFDIGPDYYNFVDIRYIGAPVLSRHIYAPTQNITYINQTVNVTNITYNNNTVYNYGPDYSRLSAYSTQPIQRLTVERVADANYNAAAQSGDFTKVEGNKLVVAAPPRLDKPAEPVAPPQVAAKIEQADVETGWAGVADPQAKAKLQEKIKKEDRKSVPPPEIPPQNPAALTAASPAPASGDTPPAPADNQPGNGASADDARGGNGRGRGREKREAAGAIQPPSAGAPTADDPAASRSGAAEQQRGRGRDKRNQLDDPRQQPAASGSDVAPADDPKPDVKRRGRGGRETSPANPPIEGDVPAPAPEEQGKNKGGRGSQRPGRDADIVLPPQQPQPQLDVARPPQDEDRGGDKRERGRGKQRQERADEVAIPQPIREVAPPQPQAEDRGEKRDKGRGRQRIERGDDVAIPQPPVREFAPPQPQDDGGGRRGAGRQRFERPEPPREVARPQIQAPPQAPPQIAPAGPPPAPQEGGRGGGKPDKGEKKNKGDGDEE
jgi:hypothetical protein